MLGVRNRWPCVRASFLVPGLDVTITKLVNTLTVDTCFSFDDWKTGAADQKPRECFCSSAGNKGGLAYVREHVMPWFPVLFDITEYASRKPFRDTIGMRPT